jgi:hypothetical protein
LIEYARADITGTKFLLFWDGPCRSSGRKIVASRSYISLSSLTAFCENVEQCKTTVSFHPSFLTAFCENFEQCKTTVSFHPSFPLQHHGGPTSSISDGKILRVSFSKQSYHARNNTRFKK